MTRAATPHDPACAGVTGGGVRIGISGWNYPSWRGAFYPQGLPQRRELEYAASVFDTIELNGPFYSLRRPGDYAHWREQSPDGFVFAVKGPRYITHYLSLKRARTPLANFFASGLARLGDRLGPILWQLPARHRFDRRKLARFLELLPADTRAAATLAMRHDDHLEERADADYGACRPLRHALEVRNESFRDRSFVAMLREHGVALVVTDAGDRWPRFEDVTTDFVYVRLHGALELYASGYTRAALRAWAARVSCWRAGGEPDDAMCAAPEDRPRRAFARDVFCYFDNDARVRAPVDAQNLRMLVAGRDEAWKQLHRRR